MNTIEKIPYVSICHWWFNRAAATWFPSRKQIFLPKSAWFGLLDQSERVSSVVGPIPEPTLPSFSGIDYFLTNGMTLFFACLLN